MYKPTQAKCSKNDPESQGFHTIVLLPCHVLDQSGLVSAGGSSALCSCSVSKLLLLVSLLSSMWRVLTLCHGFLWWSGEAYGPFLRMMFLRE